MSFNLVDEMYCVKEDKMYLVKLYLDSDTNTQRHEYVLDDEILYYIEYEALQVEESQDNLEIYSIADGFDAWYDQFGPDWRPEPF